MTRETGTGHSHTEAPAGEWARAALYVAALSCGAALAGAALGPAAALLQLLWQSGH